MISDYKKMTVNQNKRVAKRSEAIDVPKVFIVKGNVQHIHFQKYYDLGDSWRYLGEQGRC